LFDLVFALAFTQVATALADDLTFAGSVVHVLNPIGRSPT
jgi:low temperature requirement protein LtrA